VGEGERGEKGEEDRSQLHIAIVDSVVKPTKHFGKGGRREEGMGIQCRSELPPSAKCTSMEPPYFIVLYQSKITKK
jgi:hypothetical protein